MRASQQEKDRSHARIVAGAARLVREKGIDGTSVADVMTEAGLTHGGFYRHFRTKDALAAAAIAAAFDQIAKDLADRAATDGPDAAAAWYRANYLSPGHVANPGIGCPMPALGSEAARAAPDVKSAFGEGVRRTAALLATAAGSEQSAIRELAMLAGAVMMARASDPGTAERVLSACR